MLARAAIAPRKKNAPRPAEKSAPGFLQWLRGRRCACEGLNPHCGGKMQSAHVPDPATKGIGTKSRDQYAIPLTGLCHTLQHQKGWPWFVANILRGRDPRTLAESYWQAWPGRAAWEKRNG